MYNDLPSGSQRVSEAREDIMYAVLSRSAQFIELDENDQNVRFSNLESFYAITEGAFRIALGMDWRNEDVENAINYFNAYFYGDNSVDDPL
ncbi:hypothetical protein PN498_17950 [Oscillatoria sp. CS-180]|uniref:hypothetical protein n=1 Tax=Oscillatoria sp. CS-180 TaxID=3021720 RepID=UPI00232CDE15|nr:hypothetical protein [Oscillatoria sp. CS-180]MDB9527884.1 hypothetical protein [Oscillatoria sp. CS-180]